MLSSYRGRGQTTCGRSEQSVPGTTSCPGGKPCREATGKPSPALSNNKRCQPHSPPQERFPAAAPHAFCRPPYCAIWRLQRSQDFRFDPVPVSIHSPVPGQDSSGGPSPCRDRSAEGSCGSAGFSLPARTVVATPMFRQLAAAIHGGIRATAGCWLPNHLQTPSHSN